MGEKIPLLRNFPLVNRDLSIREAEKTEEDRAIARQFGKEFFDGERKHGYGGYYYHPRFWEKVVEDIIEHYHLTAQSAVLDVGCAKGFLLYELTKALPGIRCTGIDISTYAVMHAHEKIKSQLMVADARELPFSDQSFDLVLSINTIHNFEGEDLLRSLREIQRVTRQDAFIMVDGYETDEEKMHLLAWNLTARSILHEKEWLQVFDQAGYQGDYDWFIPK